MTNQLVLRVAADSWNGDPQFSVTVDGKQVGGVLTTSVQHSSGNWQDITVSGDFAANPSAVVVTFLNDGYGGWGQDRNLYVASLTLNGQTLAGSAGTNKAGETQNGVAGLFTNGSLSFNTGSLAAAATTASAAAAATTTTTTTASQNTLVLRVAADSWNGDPQFTVMVDGKQVGGVLTTNVQHSSGQWQDITLTGDFGSNPKSVAVKFSNDAYGGSGSKDRNLYVASLTINGQSLTGGSGQNGAGQNKNGVAGLYTNGTVTFDTSALTAGASSSAAPAVATGQTTTTAAQNTLVLRVAADSWNGDPQFTVTVDGKQVGGVLTTNVQHSSGQWQDITLTGNFGTNPSAVQVTFNNDSYGGSSSKDRNLYVSSLTLNGHTVQGATSTNGAGTNTSGVAQMYSNGSITFNTSALTQAAVSTPAASTGTAPTTTSTTGTSSSSGLQLLGVNLAGAEFGSSANPGTYGTNYIYPTTQEIDYYAGKGMNVIRVPFLWERLQNSIGGALNKDELARLTSVVDYATQKGLKVILDPHDYGSGFGNLIGSASTPNSAFADFWGKLASSFKSNNNVIFGLMNEPNAQNASTWLQSANDAIAAIRATGAKQEVLVPGTYWDGAWTWTSTDNASVIGTGIKDSANNYAFEVHQYLDSDGSGTKAGVASETIGVDRLTSITNWAEKNGAKLFLGEFGVSQDQASLSALDNMLTYMSKHSDAWQGGTYWAGGPWWWGSNIYGVEPNGLGTSNVTDQPQMAILTQHLQKVA